MVLQTISIAGRLIGPGHPPFVIAELSGNHNGSLDRAVALVDAAAAAGADAIKLQTYTADTITIDHDGPEFRLTEGLWAGRTLHDLYQEAHTPWAWHETLFRRGHDQGVIVFSSPFDTTAIDFLETLDAPAYKIASFEIVDLPLIRHAARTGKPLIMSTGMARLDEIEEAVEAARDEGNDNIALLHCVSGYPTPTDEANLSTIADLAKRFGVTTGLSDHTLGIAVPICAASLGATIIEKHMTGARADGGPDAAFSLEPDEFKALTEGCRTAYGAIGSVDYDLKPSEAENVMLRRSLYAVGDVAEGEVFTAENVRSIRPGFGLQPKLLPRVLGRRATGPIPRGTALREDHVSGLKADAK